MLQSLSGIPSYFCSDCKKYYDSASSLLNHFAQHITQKHDRQTSGSDSEDSSMQNYSFLTYNQNKRKKESILEKVLKQAVVNQPTRTETNSPVSSSTSEYYTSSSSDIDNSQSEQEREIPLSVIELGHKTFPNSQIKNNLMLVKFDLQTRLEDCILKLAAKRDSKMDSAARSVLNVSQDTWKTSGLPIITSKDLTVSLASATPSNNAEVDEFSPLKFCVVTMGEGDGKVSLDAKCSKHPATDVCCTVSTKTSSNRKQLTPKKIVNVKKKQDEVTNVIKEKVPTKKKYPCLVCCKVFGWSTDLKRHMLTHTGERPFKCQQCPATFTRNFLLQKHESKQHPTSLCSGMPVPNESQKAGLQDSTKATSVSKVAEANGEGIRELHLERKRKLQRTLNGQFDNSSIIEKRLESYQCSPINLGIFSQQALNIV